MGLLSLIYRHVLSKIDIVHIPHIDDVNQEGHITKSQLQLHQLRRFLGPIVKFLALPLSVGLVLECRSQPVALLHRSIAWG